MRRTRAGATTGGGADIYKFLGHTKFISGARAMEHIPYELAGFDAGRPLVIAEPGIAKKGLAKKFLSALADSNMTVGALFDDAPPYASVAVIGDLGALFRDRGCDSLVALGDGPAVDIAKGVNMLVTTGVDSIMEFEGENLLSKRLKPSVVVPACGATGLEAANRATIEGRTFVSDFLFPDLVCIDARMVKSASPEAIAGASLAAFAHCVEAAAFPHNNPMTDMYAHAAIQFLYEHMRRLPRSPGTKGCVALANAFAMAGVVFSNAPAGIVHLLATALADETGVPAGIAMGILLPCYLDYKTGVMKEDVREELLLAMAGIDEYCATPEKERALKSIALLKGLLRGMKESLPRTLADLRIPPYKLKAAAELAAARGDGRVDLKSCTAILDRACSAASTGQEGFPQ
ncbi:MAG: iron-containing alcohol dehydrogenase [Spirochaetes bacterium]|nr:MAG: iron-containing alcohol dehydrogenase [Spirochaetota bacterium]